MPCRACRPHQWKTANGNYSSLISSAVNNFGLEFWVKPADTTGNKCLAYNGDTGERSPGAQCADIAGRWQFSIWFHQHARRQLHRARDHNLALPLTDWTPLSNVVENPAGQFRFTDPQATNSGQRFYRVRSP